VDGDYRPPLTLDGDEARDLVEALDLVAESDGDVRQMMSRAPAAALRSERLRFRAVCAWLWEALATSSLTSRNRQPSEADVVAAYAKHLPTSRQVEAVE
jgi:hypothetical protein